MELISPKEARKILGIGRNKQVEFAKSGVLARYKIPGVQGYKYDLKQVLALICQDKK